MWRTPISFIMPSRKLRIIVEFLMLMKLLPHLSRLKSRITVCLTMWTCSTKKLMLLKITTSGWTPRLKSTRYSQSKTKLRNLERSRISRIKHKNTSKILKRPMTSASLSKMNSTQSRTMFKRWCRCSSKLSFRAMSQWGNLMMKTHSSMSRILGTI